MTEQPTTSPTAPAAEPSQRRGLLAGFAAVVIGSVITLVPIVSGGLFALDPIRRKRDKFRGSVDGFLPVARLSDLPADGTPQRYPVIADVIDAWNLFKNRTLGTIYLRKIGETVIAFNDVCPHLGCKVNYQSSERRFHCPCHASTFGLDGVKKNKIPPRNLDTLETKVIDGQVWVKYQDFRGGVAEKIPT